MPVYKIDHETVYDYTLPVVISQHLAHLLPRQCERQTWREHTLTIRPEPAIRQERLDFYGNRPVAFSIEEEHRRFLIKASGTVEVRRTELPKNTPSWETVAARLIRPQEEDDWAAATYAYPSPLVSFDDAIRQYTVESFTPGQSIFAAAMDLTTRIYRDFTYAPATTRIGTMPPEILRERRGVCQDFAHLMSAGLRSLGLACRYVSGYLLTYPPLGQAKRIGADATHAWVSVYMPPHGWVEFDPTNNLAVGDEHIVVAWGRDFSDVSPLKGVITGGGPHTVKVAVNVAAV